MVLGASLALAVDAGAARDAWLTRLRDHRPGDPVLVGQHTGHGAGVRAGYGRHFADLGIVTGRIPRLCGVDYGWDHLDPQEIAEANRVLKAHAARGGWITVSMSPGNPCTGGGVQEVSGVDVVAMLTPGTPAERAWTAMVDVVAVGLRDLQDAGLPVLWRPFHESNGGFFWWASEQSGIWTRPDDFRRLWHDLYRRLTVDHGLRNLIWVFAAQARLDLRIRPVDTYLPTLAEVDVVGLDLYTTRLDATTLGEDYARLKASGRPFLIAEIGPPADAVGTLDGSMAWAAMLTHCPDAVAITWWQSWSRPFLWTSRWQALALGDNPGAAAVLWDPRADTLSWP